VAPDLNAQAAANLFNRTGDVAALGRQRHRQHVGGAERRGALDVYLPAGAAAPKQPPLVAHLGPDRGEERVAEPDQPSVVNGPGSITPPAKATQAEGSANPWAWPHHQAGGKPPWPQFFSP
jgi:hypothetical protein